jgi:hypothetical protein
LSSHLTIRIFLDWPVAIHRRLYRMALKAHRASVCEKYSNEYHEWRATAVNGVRGKRFAKLLHSVRKHNYLVSASSRHSVSPLSEPKIYGEPELASTKRSALFPVAKPSFAIKRGIPSAPIALTSTILHTVRLVLPTGTDVNDVKVSQYQATRCRLQRVRILEKTRSRVDVYTQCVPDRIPVRRSRVATRE